MYHRLTWVRRYHSRTWVHKTPDRKSGEAEDHNVAVSRRNSTEDHKVVLLRSINWCEWGRDNREKYFPTSIGKRNYRLNFPSQIRSDVMRTYFLLYERNLHVRALLVSVQEKSQFIYYWGSRVIHVMSGRMPQTFPCKHSVVITLGGRVYRTELEQRARRGYIMITCLGHVTFATLTILLSSIA
jgi:hypothetical protein